MGSIDTMLSKLDSAHPAGTAVGTTFGNAQWIILVSERGWRAA